MSLYLSAPEPLLHSTFWLPLSSLTIVYCFHILSLACPSHSSVSSTACWNLCSFLHLLFLCHPIMLGSTWKNSLLSLNSGNGYQLRSLLSPFFKPLSSRVTHSSHPSPLLTNLLHNSRRELRAVERKYVFSYHSLLSIFSTEIPAAKSSPLEPIPIPHFWPCP